MFGIGVLCWISSIVFLFGHYQRPEIGVPLHILAYILMIASVPLLTAPHRLSEDVRVVPVVVPELELGNVERQVLRAHLMERADHAALEDRPEAFNRVGMDRADNVVALGMIDNDVRIFLVEMLIANPSPSSWLLLQPYPRPASFAGVDELHAGIFERLADRRKVVLDWETAAVFEIGHGLAAPIPVVSLPA